ncbi:PAS domain-containing protein [Streptomyces sp. RS10V-4]|uniref:response regulator n=1 Tax=Streptomyces rhizoryzae TaxID=2932493 RepID=UPI002004241D|nr:PAS domain-containing protein [Streptomyces rhizoryzae]MCK7627518.1 PAS domain-containing protein [Streptomyces rhizoryzae]
MSSRPSRGAARLAAILDALPDALLLVNCNGTVVNANAIALEMFEAPGTALVGRGLLDLLPTFDSKRIPGSMRRRDEEVGGRTKPTRMIARRTDGRELLVEVTSANLEDGRTPYESAFEAAYADHRNGYTGDELLMLVVRDLSGTLDTETELARQQRQTEMILRAAAEGVVGVDSEGRVVLVNPSAAQILGYRASELGGKELHPLVHHSRADGSALPWEDTPLADTLKSGRKHRVRGQVLWAKDGRAVAVDLTTAPVRDGDQLVGAVMTFTDRRPFDALVARHEQLLAVLARSLRGPLEELSGELTTLASDPAGQLWPEANQILHHLAAGHARMTTLVDNVLSYQRLDSGTDKLNRTRVSLDQVVAAGVEGAVELIGPGRAQFAVHAPPIAALVDPERLAQALSHLIADVAGVDSTGRTAAAEGPAGAGGRPVPGDSTIVVAAAKRGQVVRIEVRGPFGGGDPVHGPIVRGIVRMHDGLIQTHKVPGGSGAAGSAYVLELPVLVEDGEPADGGADGPEEAAGPGESGTAGGPGQALAPAGAKDGTGGGRRRARHSGPGQAPAADGTQGAGLPAGTAGAEVVAPGGRRRARQAPEGAALPALPAGTGGGTPAGGPPPGLTPAVGPALGPVPPGGRRARRALTEAPERGASAGAPAQDSGAPAPRAPFALPPAAADRTPQPQPGPGPRPPAGQPALPAISGGMPVQAADGPGEAAGTGRRRARRPVAGGPQTASGNGPADGTGDRPAPAGDTADSPGAQGAWDAEPTGRRRARRAAAEERAAAAMADSKASGTFVAGPEGLVAPPAEPAGPEGPAGVTGTGPGSAPGAAGAPGAPGTPGAPAPAGPAPTVPAQGPAPASAPAPTGRRRGRPSPAEEAAARPAPGSAAVPAQGPAPAGRQPLPDGADESGHTSGRAFSVRTLGQGVPFAQQLADPQRPAPQPGAAPAGSTPPGGTSAGSGRRRKLAAPPPEGARQEAAASGAVPHQATGPQPQVPARPKQPGPQPHLMDAGEGRAFAISAPDEGSEGPEPLDGPNGAVEVMERQQPPLDDELPPEPLDNPRRLLVWPAPDVATRQALSDRGYRPVIVNSREEVDAQIAAYPAALFVDPLTGPITRTALQSLRQAAGAAEVPVLVTAGLGQATREAAYGADPAVLLKALAPRDGADVPPRVLLIEQNDAIAGALTASLERRGMRVGRAGADTDAVALATQLRPNLVVMDLMQVRRRRAGIVDWLRANGMLDHTPLVVYTAADLDPAQLPGLASGETVLFLAERSTSAEVQTRIVDLLAKIGTN